MWLPLLGEIAHKVAFRYKITLTVVFLYPNHKIRIILRKGGRHPVPVNLILGVYDYYPDLGDCSRRRGVYQGEIWWGIEKGIAA